LRLKGATLAVCKCQLDCYPLVSAGGGRRNLAFSNA
jgi:hypothetical protein